MYDNSSSTLSNVTFNSNQATEYGGGMYSSGSSTLTGVAFSGNDAGTNGGGMFSSGSSTLIDVTFNSNQAEYGGGMYNSGSSTLINAAFSGNQADGYGGGMYNSTSNATLNNIAFSGNLAGVRGGGMYISSSSPALTNVTFSANQAGLRGGGICNYAGNPTLTNTILWSNTAPVGAQMYNYSNSSPVVNYSLAEGGCPGVGTSCDAHLLTTDPRFADADGADDVVGTLDDDLRLMDDSPAIDAGDNTAVPADTHDLDGDGNTTEPLPYDMNGNSRFIDHLRTDSGSGAPPLVDLGAYETPGFWLVKTTTPSVLDAGDHLTYTLAFHAVELTATHVVISDVIPISVSVTSVLSAGVAITDTGASSGYVWHVQDLAPGQGGVITITGVVSDSLLPAQTFTNTFAAAGTFNGLIRTGAASAVIAIHGADLALDKRVNVPIVAAGDTITYTITATNHGPDGTPWVKVGDALPPGTSYVSSAATQGFYISGHSAWYVGPLPAGGSATLDIVARVDSGVPAGTHITNTAVISANDTADDITGNNTASAVIIATQADLAVAKTAPPVVLAGGQLTYTLVVTNHGPASSPGTILTDTLPETASFVSASPSCSHDGGTTVTCVAGSLADQATRTFTITVTAPITAGPITNTVTAAGDGLDLDPSNNTAAASTWVSAQADLAVAKEDSADPVVAGTPLTYTLVVTNYGPDWVIGATLTDVLPSGVTPPGSMVLHHLGEDAGATYFADNSGFGHYGACSGDSCPTAGLGGRYGQAVQFDGVNDFIEGWPNVSETSYGVSLWFKTSCTNCGIFSVDRGSLGSAGIDRHIYLSGGNLCTWVYDSETICTSGVNYADDVWHHVVHTFGGSVGGQRIYVDGALRRSGTLDHSDFTRQTGVNIGFANLAGNDYFSGLIDEVVIYDRALSETEIGILYYTAAIDLGLLAPGEVVTMTMPVIIGSEQGGTLVNTASVSSDVSDPHTDDNTATETTEVLRPADLAVAKTGAPAVLAGAPLTYTLTVTNHGPFDATGVVLTDTLPGSATFLSASPECSHGGGVTVTCNVSDLANQATAVFTVTVTAPGVGGTITNTVTVTGDGPDDVLSNNTALQVAWISAEADLAISKYDSADSVVAGTIVTYTLVVTNHGPDWAIGVTLTDTLPPGAIPVSGPMSDPVLSLHLDEDAGATHFVDLSGLGHHGTCITCPITGVSGRYGQAVQFDGLDDFIEVEIDVSETDYAVSLWFKTVYTDCGIFSVDVGTLGSSTDRHIYLDGGDLCTRVWDNETICTSGVDYADGGWHHVVHTFGGSVGGQRIYVDGALQQSGAKAASDFDWQTGVNIGYSRDADNRHFEVLSMRSSSTTGPYRIPRSPPSTRTV
jgi:uncharacterized repeat protein (TIGR01451 family)